MKTRHNLLILLLLFAPLWSLAQQSSAQKVGVNGTPSFVINGQLVVGALPIDAFKKAVDKALAEANK